MGVPCLKCPLDLWVYQEILAQVRPALVLETGTHRGGSALAPENTMAAILQAIEEGDLSPENVKKIATELSVSEEDVINMNRRLAAPDHSLNAPLKIDGDGEWQDWLVDESDSQEIVLAEQQEQGAGLGVGAGEDGGERIGNREAAVIVPVPIHADIFAGGLHDLFDREFQ